jgi:lysophospholipase L1-like esterase
MVGRVIRPKIIALTAVIGLGFALAACADDSTTTDGATVASPEPDPVLTYVALGDSYAALGSVESPNTGPETCQRSADNYPSHVLDDPQVEGQDVSCGGAVTDDLLQPLATQAEEIPAQVDALTEDVDVVTLSVGGNDIGFGGIVNCYVAAIQAGQPSNCGPALQAGVEAQMAQLPAKLDGVYDAIDERSPDAEVIATGYMPLLAPGDECTEVAVISPEDREWIIALTDDLNQHVRDAAERHGGTAVLPEGVEDHTGCAAPAERWVDFFGFATDAYPMHPTSVGQEAMADAVLAEL